MPSFNLGAITGMLGSWFIWIGLAVLLIVFAIGFVYVRKKAKFTFPCLIFSDIGAGKSGIEVTKCGWFKSKKIFGGFFEVGGERQLETEDGRVVRFGGTDQFHEIKFKRGILCYAKPDDPKILVPINKTIVDNEDILMQIAPAIYREVSGQINEENSKEAQGLLDKLLPIIGIGLSVIVFIVAMFVLSNTIKGTTAELKAMHESTLATEERMMNLLSTTASTGGAK